MSNQYSVPGPKSRVFRLRCKPLIFPEKGSLNITLIIASSAKKC